MMKIPCRISEKFLYYGSLIQDWSLKMVRMSKQGKRRALSPHKTKYPSVKTGSKKDNLPKGYKEHANAAPQERAIFIPKIK